MFGIYLSQEGPGGARRSQEEPGGAREARGRPGESRRSERAKTFRCFVKLHESRTIVPLEAKKNTPEYKETGQKKGYLDFGPPANIPGAPCRIQNNKEISSITGTPNTAGQTALYYGCTCTTFFLVHKKLRTMLALSRRNLL